MNPGRMAGLGLVSLIILLPVAAHGATVPAGFVLAQHVDYRVRMEREAAGYVRAGYRALKHGQLDRARDWFQKARNLFPDHKGAAAGLRRVKAAEAKRKAEEEAKRRAEAEAKRRAAAERRRRIEARRRAEARQREEARRRARLARINALKTMFILLRKNVTSWLTYFFKDKNTQQIMSIIKRFPSLVNSQDPKNGCTALHYAAGAGNHWLAKFLLSRGANINIRDKDNQTPIECAREMFQKMKGYTRGDWAEVIRILKAASVK